MVDNKVPVVSIAHTFVNVGAGVLSYAPDLNALGARGATFVDRILRGASPADLPVEMATKFELVINKKAARAIGYDLPQSLLARADRVIE